MGWEGKNSVRRSSLWSPMKQKDQGEKEESCSYQYSEMEIAQQKMRMGRYVGFRSYRALYVPLCEEQRGRLKKMI